MNYNDQNEKNIIPRAVLDTHVKKSEEIASREDTLFRHLKNSDNKKSNIVTRKELEKKLNKEYKYYFPISNQEEFNNMCQKNQDFILSFIEQSNDILKLTDDEIFKKEQKAFTVDGESLNLPARLTREYLKIDNAMAFGKGEELDSETFNYLRKLKNSLIEKIDEFNVNQIPKQYCYICEIIVFMDIFLDIEISFYSALRRIDQTIYQLLKNNYEDLNELTAYEEKTRTI